MKVLKRIFTMFSAALFLVSMTACSNGNDNREAVTDRNQESEDTEYGQTEDNILIAYTPEEEVAFVAEQIQATIGGVLICAGVLFSSAATSMKEPRWQRHSVNEATRALW